MGVIALTEYQTTVLDSETLPYPAGTRLYQQYEQKRPILHIDFPSPKTNGNWHITPQGWVGHIPLNHSLSFIIQPKVPLSNLFRMVEYAYGLKSFHWLDGLVACDTLNEFYEQLARLFAQRVLRRIQQGLHKAYLDHTAQLPYVRGRVVPTLTTQPHQLTSEFQEQTSDIPDNQLLLWTLRHILLSGLCTTQSLPLVRRAYRALQNHVSLRTFAPQECLQHTYTRLNSDYRPLHALCYFFLSNTGPSHHLGERETLPFLVDMASLYEQFVAGWLKHHLPPSWSVKAQERLPIGQKGEFTYHIDLVLYDEHQRVRAVLDTKYKAPTKTAPADFNQIVTYAQARGCDTAILIYPQPLARPLNTTLHNLTIRTLTFALHGDLTANGKSFLSQLLPEPKFH